MDTKAWLHFMYQVVLGSLESYQEVQCTAATQKRGVDTFEIFCYKAHEVGLLVARPFEGMKKKINFNIENLSLMNSPGLRIG